MPDTRASKSSNPSTGHDSDPTSEFVSMATLREMMQMQERMFKTMFESVLSSVNTRIDEVVKSVAELRASLQYSQRDIDDFMKSTGELAMIEDELDDIQHTLDKHEDKMEYLENQSRRNNIRIDGITEVGNETWLDTETKAKQILKEKLNLDCEPEIERAHRVGPKPRTTVPNVADGLRTRLRTIVCRLRDWKQKEGILRAARQTKPSGLFVSEDLAAETLDKRSSQLDKLKEAKRAGKIAYFVLDRLIVKDRPPRESR